MLFRLSSSLKCFCILFFITPAIANESGSLIWNITDQDRQFIGRQDELEKIKRMYAKEYLIAVVGLAGIGKTNFVKQYAIQNRPDYKVCWFIDARRDIEAQLFELAQELSEKKLINENLSPHSVTEGAKAALKWLRSTEDSWFLIFDNVDGRQDISDFIPEKYNNAKKHVLITARHGLGWSKSLQLPTFSDIESLSFLKTTLRDPYPEEELLKLSKTLGNHPRALLQASLHISRVPSMTCKKYVEMFAINNNKLTKEEKMILSHKEANSELHTSLESLMDNIKSTSPESLPFLATLSYMSCSNLEEELLVKSQEMLGHGGELTYLNLINPALLVKEGKGYSIHPYVATVVQNYISEDKRQKALENGLIVLASYLDKNTDEIVKMFEQNPNFLNHILDITKHYKGTSPLATELEVAALYYIYYYQRRYDLAWDLAQQCKQRIELRGSQNYSLDEGRFYSLYSLLFQIKGSLEGAIEAAIRAVAILEKIDDPFAREELVMLLNNNLASLYNAQGETKSALECVGKSSSLLGKNCSLKNELVILYVKILCAIDEGDFDSARSFVNEQRTKLENEEFAKFVLHVTNLLGAKVEIKSSNMKLAKEYAEQAYQQALSCSGNDETHETVGRVGTMLAICDLSEGNFPRAELLIDKAIKGFTESYGDLKNRQQAYAYMVKGDILVEREDLTGAMDNYSKSLKIYDTEFTSMKVDDVSELYFRFINLGLLLDEKLLTEDFLDKHIRIFGKLHPRSVAARQAIKKASEPVSNKEK